MAQKHQMGGGRTGDINGNIRRLQQALRHIHYGADVNIDGAKQGLPEVYLPLIHYALLSFSRPVARWLATLGHDLYGKSDLRFMEGAFKVLRDNFGYVPKITKEQFFSMGFAEQKAIIAADVCRMCAEKHEALSRSEDGRKRESSALRSSNGSTATTATTTTATAGNGSKGSRSSHYVPPPPSQLMSSDVAEETGSISTLLPSFFPTEGSFLPSAAAQPAPHTPSRDRASNNTRTSAATRAHTTSAPATASSMKETHVATSATTRAANNAQGFGSSIGTSPDAAPPKSPGAHRVVSGRGSAAPASPSQRAAPVPLQREELMSSDDVIAETPEIDTVYAAEYDDQAVPRDSDNGQWSEGAWVTSHLSRAPPSGGAFRHPAAHPSYSSSPSDFGYAHADLAMVNSGRSSGARTGSAAGSDASHRLEQGNGHGGAQSATTFSAQLHAYPHPSTHHHNGGEYQHHTHRPAGYASRPVSGAQAHSTRPPPPLDAYSLHPSIAALSSRYTGSASTPALQSPTTDAAVLAALARLSQDMQTLATTVTTALDALDQRVGGLQREVQNVAMRTMLVESKLMLLDSLRPEDTPR